MFDPELLAQYVVTPLTEAEIAEVEVACNKPIPQSIRDWLATVGAPQNVCYRLPHDASDFVDLQRGVPAELFAFSWDENSEVTYAVDRNGKVHLESRTRPELIPESLTEFVLMNLAGPEPLDDVKWHTQLSFSTSKEQEVLEVLSRAFALSRLSGWEYQDTSPARVITHHNRCESPQGPTKISRQTYQGWPTPIYYLNRVISLDEIRKAKDAFRRFEELDLGFKLINYGLLSLNDDQDEDAFDD